MDTYEVKVWLEGNTQPIVYQALAVYQQGALLCIAYTDKEGEKRVRKFPIDHIWAIDEEYKYVRYKPTAQEVVYNPVHQSSGRAEGDK